MPCSFSYSYVCKLERACRSPLIPSNVQQQSPGVRFSVRVRDSSLIRPSWSRVALSNNLFGWFLPSLPVSGRAPATGPKQPQLWAPAPHLTN